MKARVKATGEIVEITMYSRGVDYYNQPYVIYETDNHRTFRGIELELMEDDAPDYWTRLEHKAAIAAMQGILSNPVLLETTLTNAKRFDLTDPQAVAIDAYHYAHALVEKYKKEK